MAFPSDSAAGMLDVSNMSIRDQLKRLYDIVVPHTLRDFVKFIFYKDQNVGWLID